MSLLAILALAAAPVAGASPVEPSDEIVVLARKLENWRGSWRTRKGAITCTTTRSTGDAGIDGVGCGALVACVKPIVPAMQAIADSKLPKAERNRRMTDMAQSIGPCVASERQAGIAALADRQAGL